MAEEPWAAAGGAPPSCRRRQGEAVAAEALSLRGRCAPHIRVPASCADLGGHRSLRAAVRVSHGRRSPMYTLYNVKRWGSMAPHFLLEELDVPYQSAWMTPEQVREPEFRDLSPLGYIPVL